MPSPGLQGVGWCDTCPPSWLHLLGLYPKVTALFCLLDIIHLFLTQRLCTSFALCLEHSSFTSIFGQPLHILQVILLKPLQNLLQVTESFPQLLYAYSPCLSFFSEHLGLYNIISLLGRIFITHLLTLAQNLHAKRGMVCLVQCCISSIMSSM